MCSCVSGDMTSGLTVAVMHIPQGLAYALLGNVPPVVGIYMAFIPVLIYTMLGKFCTLWMTTMRSLKYLILGLGLRPIEAPARSIGQLYAEVNTFPRDLSVT